MLVSIWTYLPTNPADLVVGTPRKWQASLAIISRRMDRNTARPSWTREYGVWPEPFNWICHLSPSLWSNLSHYREKNYHWSRTIRKTYFIKINSSYFTSYLFTYSPSISARPSPNWPTHNPYWWPPYLKTTDNICSMLTSKLDDIWSDIILQP